jgi:aryl-alcohol dehydrogenase-like predicted oxidoreductase
MKDDKNRRIFIKNLASLSACLFLAPEIVQASMSVNKNKLMTRRFGKINFDVTTMGLGGQAALQWTPADIDPVRIIEKAFSLGINYYDTSNVYGPSQLNYGKAFRNLNLIPNEANYNKELRESIFLTAKSGLRLAKGYKKNPAIKDMSEGDFNAGCIGDLKRTLTQIFGDGEGKYPEGAYVNMFLVHNVETMEDVDTAYLGLDEPSPDMEQIGALAALLDYRDGTNKTGLNPKNERLIRHIGFSGHNRPSVLMEMIQRDTKNILDAVLIPLNSNDLGYRSMQYNVLPVARAKNMGVIAMKIFADGVMFGRKKYGNIIRTVGSSTLNSKDLVQYTVSTPGVHVAIIGIGQINDDPATCQLSSNLSAAQIEWDKFSLSKRKALETVTAQINMGKTNGFQEEGNQLLPPRKVSVKVVTNGKKQKIILNWNTAYSGAEPLDRYEIYRNDQLVGTIPFKPQITKNPYQFTQVVKNEGKCKYVVAVVDTSGQKATAEPVLV